MREASEMLYQLNNVSTIHGDRTIIDIPQLGLEPGKIYALTGPNGAGKTTLLQLLAFLVAPDKGNIMFNGQLVVQSEPLLQPIRRRIVMVDQNPVLFSRSVFKNVELPLLLRKNQPAHDHRALVEAALKEVDMLAAAEVMGSHLSIGEIQRVALARAMVCSPEVLLLDEPTSNIDKPHQPVIENLLRQTNKKGKVSIIFSTHSMHLVEKLADHLLVMENGKIKQS